MTQSIIDTGLSGFTVVRTSTDGYSATNGELVITDGQSVSLPDPTTNAGAVILVKPVGNDVTLTTPVGTIANQTETAVYRGRDAVWLQSDGSDWYVRSDLSTVTSDIPDSALTQHLVAWYRFEDGDARDYTNDLDATFADSTAYDGAINGATYQPTGGVTDFDNGSNSGVFDFSGSRIDLPSFSSSFMEGDVFTISAFFKTSDTSRQVITGNFAGASPNRGNYIRLNDENSNGNLDIAYRQKDDSATQDIFFVDGSSVDITTYTHVAVVRDGSGGANGTRIYINGQNQTLNTDVNEGATVSGIKTFDYEIGGNPKFGDNFVGEIDEVRFYDTNLSASQINDIYQNTKP